MSPQPDTTALLCGESGTGKELVAHAVHEASQRAKGPFVPLECAGLTEALFESELFGHEKGAFTGAHARRIGLVEAAQAGTLFLDEVGDIPLALQVKLLRLLETHCFRRVGSTDPTKADFRLICATRRDLKRRVGEGTFRQDLYYRLSAFPIRLPALRERLDDLPLLIDALLIQTRERRELKLASVTLTCLETYDFPGNVRELRNLLERATLLADGDTILPEHLPEECQCTDINDSLVASDILSLAQIERRYLRRIAGEHNGDRRDLARKLGISERTLHRKLRRAGL